MANLVREDGLENRTFLKHKKGKNEKSYFPNFV